MALRTETEIRRELELLRKIAESECHAAVHRRLGRRACALRETISALAWVLGEAE